MRQALILWARPNLLNSSPECQNLWLQHPICDNWEFSNSVFWVFWVACVWGGICRSRDFHNTTCGVMTIIWLVGPNLDRLSGKKSHSLNKLLSTIGRVHELSSEWDRPNQVNGPSSEWFGTEIFSLNMSSGAFFLYRLHESLSTVVVMMAIMEVMMMIYFCPQTF